MRKLAYITKIDSIEPIEGKDRIVLAHIVGWQAIVNKEDFKAGDVVIFCEPDCVMPKTEEFAFLEKHNYRIKTIKMGGVISQGLVLPIRLLTSNNLTIGRDVTSELGIVQYELPDNKPEKQKKYNPIKSLWKSITHYFYGDAKKPFPDFIKKTDEERIQNRPEVLEWPLPWIATEKIDGQSATYFLRKKKFLCFKKYEFGVCSRNLQIAHEDTSSYWTIAKRLKIKEKLLSIIKKNEPWVVIQGEIIGPGIQKNKYDLKDYDFYVFNLIRPKTGRENSLSSKCIIEKELGLKHVPIINASMNLKGKTVNEVLEIATDKSVVNPKILREGIVFRNTLNSCSFKAVSPQFLIKYDE